MKVPGGEWYPTDENVPGPIFGIVGMLDAGRTDDSAMRLTEAVELLGAAVPKVHGFWVDFGAGTGLFTRALIELVTDGATIFAVDRDPRAVAGLRETAIAEGNEKVRLVPLEGDYRYPMSISGLNGAVFDGAVFANSLHFTPDPQRVFIELLPRLAADARIAVIEYQGRRPSRWVPHPISPDALRVTAERAGFRFFGVKAARPSAYGGSMYCALLERLEE